MAELNGIWKSEDVGKSQIYCADYKQYFMFTKSYAQTQVWPTTLNPKKDIFESEKLRYTALIKNLRYGDNINELDAISGENYNPVTGYSLSEIFDSISENIQGAIIDHIEFSTGSNVERYVIPECIKPIGLNITLKNISKGKKNFT